MALMSDEENDALLVRLVEAFESIANALQRSATVAETAIAQNSEAFELQRKAISSMNDI